MWLFLRRVPITALSLRPPLIKNKFLKENRFISIIEQALRVASNRSLGADVHAHVDAIRFQFCFMWVLFGAHRPGVGLSGAVASWYSVIEERLHRLHSGDFEGLFSEAVSAAEALPDVQRGIKTDGRGNRAVELAHRGSVSKALGALTAGGMLPLEEEEVREAFSRLMQPNGEPAPAEWKDFVRAQGSQAQPPDSDQYKFVLGESEIRGPNGAPITVDTLQHVLSSLDPASAPGISGLSLGMLRKMDPEVVRPLLSPYFGNGRWDYSQRVDGRPDGALFHSETHAFMISVRAAALDKDGSSFIRGRRVSNLRPLGIGDALRRVAAKCQILQLEGIIGTRLAANGQYGCGFKNGTDTVYQLVSKGLDAFVANNVPGGSVETDARNAYGSIFRAAMQRGVLKHAPNLLPTFDFLYGPNATGRCFFYSPGKSQALGSCPLTDGVQQGDVFGPLFFSFGLDELLVSVRERMRLLPVDSTMVEQVVLVGTITDGMNAVSGNRVPISPGMVLTLLEAPTYSAVDACAENDRHNLRVLVRVGPLEGVNSFNAYVPWLAVHLCAEICLAAYLDDIHLVAEIFLLRPFTHVLRELGPSVGLHFDSLSKNFAYIPRCFTHDVLVTLPDAVQILDSTPGDSVKAQMMWGEGILQGNLRRLLISHVGIPKLMGAPLRSLCPDSNITVDREWIVRQTRLLAFEVSKLFSHLGLHPVNEGLSPFAEQCGKGDVLKSYAEGCAILPENDPQVKLFITRYCLGTRLNCIARNLPSSLTKEALGVIDGLLALTVVGCSGEQLLNPLSSVAKSRITLAARYGGLIPGAAVVSPASHLSAVAAVEGFLLQFGLGLEREGLEPPVLNMLRARITSRDTNAAAGLLTPLEQLLLNDVSLVKLAALDPEYRELLDCSSRGGDERRRIAEAAASLVAQNATSPIDSGLTPAVRDPSVDLAIDAGLTTTFHSDSIESESTGLDALGVPGFIGNAENAEISVPAAVPSLPSFQNLYASAGKSRPMGDGLWGASFIKAFKESKTAERVKMVEGLLKGAGLSVLAVPAARPFEFPEAIFRRILTEYLGWAGDVTEPWVHHCVSGSSRTLMKDTFNHLSVCPMLGRNSRPHNEVRDILTHMLRQCGVTDAAVTESTVFDRGGSGFDTDVTYLDPMTGKRVILEVSIVSLGSDTSVNTSASAGLDSAKRLLVRRENEKRQNRTICNIINEEGNQTVFIPFVMSSCGGFGPSATAFLKAVYATAKAKGHWIMSAGQPDMDTTWLTMYASTYWDMRLSVACAATDAYYQSRIILRDKTLNFPVVARQPNPDPNYNEYSSRSNGLQYDQFFRSPSYPTSPSSVPSTRGSHSRFCGSGGIRLRGRGT